MEQPRKQDVTIDLQFKYKFLKKKKVVLFKVFFSHGLPYFTVLLSFINVI